jgi:uncharacterized protein YgbK (DUF1537 family)
MPLTILADDLTGACDTGSLFAGKRPIPVGNWPGVPPEQPVRVIDTETRRLPAGLARERVRAAARAAPARRHFKKIDSTLRGPIGAEVGALIDETGAPGAVVTPAFPSQRRVVVDRVLTVDGRPVAGTPVAHDPDFPASQPAGSSSVIDLLRPQLDRPVAWIPLPEVRAGAAALAARLGRLAGAVVIADAETDADLDVLVDAALARDPAPLLVGSAGMAHALARRLGLLVERVPVPAGLRWLVVVGSRNPASREQAEHARHAGLRVLASADDAEDDRDAVARRLAQQAVEALGNEGFDVIAVTGGDTALALCHALGVDALELDGPPMPGLALGRVTRPGPPLFLVTKAGGFGQPDVFVALARGAPRARPWGAA